MSDKTKAAPHGRQCLTTKQDQHTRPCAGGQSLTAPGITGASNLLKSKQSAKLRRVSPENSGARIFKRCANPTISKLAGCLPNIVVMVKQPKYLVVLSATRKLDVGTFPALLVCKSASLEPSHLKCEPCLSPALAHSNNRVANSQLTAPLAHTPISPVLGKTQGRDYAYHYPVIGYHSFSSNYAISGQQLWPISSITWCSLAYSMTAYSLSLPRPYEENARKTKSVMTATSLNFIYGYLVVNKFRCVITHSYCFLFDIHFIYIEVGIAPLFFLVLLSGEYCLRKWIYLLPLSLIELVDTWFNLVRDGCTYLGAKSKPVQPFEKNRCMQPATTAITIKTVSSVLNIALTPQKSEVQPEGHRLSELSLAFLRWRRLISPFTAVMINCAFVSPSLRLFSNFSTTSCGKRALSCCDLLLVGPVGIAEFPCRHPFGSMPRFCNSVLPSSFSQLPRLTPSFFASVSNCSFSSGGIRIWKAGAFPVPFGCLSRLMVVDMCVPIIVLFFLIGTHLNTVLSKKTTPRTVGAVPRRLTKPLTGVTTMAKTHSTQTRPEFTWLFLATPRHHPECFPIVLRFDADTEDAARDAFPGWNLVFAAKIRAHAPCRVVFFDYTARRGWEFDSVAVQEMHHA